MFLSFKIDELNNLLLKLCIPRKERERLVAAELRREEEKNLRLRRNDTWWEEEVARFKKMMNYQI